MSLRTRLLAAFVALTLVVAAVLAIIVTRQNQLLVAQLDDRLESAIQTVVRLPITTIDPLVARGEAPPNSSGDLYVAVVIDDEEITVAQPADDPGLRLVPEGALADAIAVGARPDNATAVTVSRTDGGTARVLVARVAPGRTIVLALPLAQVDEARRQLIATAAVALAAVLTVLALVWWWIDRLGLRPIARLTDAAEEVAHGRSDRRVRHDGPATETGRLGSAFNTMLDARQLAEDRQRRFVADASHELRTPLTTLRGYTQLVAGGDLGSEATEDAMRRIRSEADRMSAMVDDLLTLASLDEGRPLDRRPLDLSRLLRDIGADAAAVQPDREVDVSEVAEDLRVTADRHLLTQAITAATTNALRHTPTDAGLRLTARPIGGAGVEITVADGGPGVATGEVDRLFERFVRADPSRATTSGGRGLGLSIARAAIEAHDGRIDATSSPEAGTTIRIELPASVESPRVGGSGTLAS